jgi:hypothetical protein
MTAFATTADLQDVDPTIADYGVLNFQEELAKAQEDVTRLLRVRWWPTYLRETKLDIRTISAPLLDEKRLDPTQWTRATVYYALGYFIYPKMTKFEPDSDRFQVMMEYYSKRFESEFDVAVREGVRYDDNDDGVFSDGEREPNAFLRLRR